MKVLIVLIAIVAHAIAFETCGKKGPGSRIINGRAAAHGEFPWQVSIRYNFNLASEIGDWQTVCGGMEAMAHKPHIRIKM